MVYHRRPSAQNSLKMFEGQWWLIPTQPLAALFLILAFLGLCGPWLFQRLFARRGCRRMRQSRADCSSYRLKFRDSPTEMDSRFRGNDGQTATASVNVTCLAEMTSFPRKRESIA